MSISASPAIITAEIAPGESTQRTVTISNNSSKPLQFEVKIYDLGLDDEGIQARFPAGSIQGSMASWLVIPEPRFSVPANGEHKAEFVISVPPGAKGGNQAALVFRTRAEVEQNAGNAVQVGAGIAVKLFHSTLGKASRSLDIVESRVNPPSAHELASVYLLIRNSGEAFVRAAAETAILDEANEFVGRGVSGATNILISGQSELLVVEWGGELPPGIYTAITTVVFEGGSVVMDEQFRVPTPSAGQRPKVD